MDKRFLRSSITVGHSLASVETNGSARVQITIDSAATPQYEFIQNKTSLQSIYFEIAEVIRDYLTITYDGTKTNQVVDCSVVLEMFDEFNATGNSLYTNTITFKGCDGYTYFEEGANFKVTANSGIAQTNLIFYLPEGVTSRVPFFNSNGFTYENILANDEGTVDIEDIEIKVNRICEKKYRPIEVVFVNRFGALESFYFTLRKTDSLDIKREEFKRNIIDSTGSYSTTTHNRQNYNVTGQEKFTLNTPYIKECMNKTMDEILLSEQIWAHVPTGCYTLRGGTGSTFLIINALGNAQTVTLGSGTKDDYCSLELPQLVTGDGGFDILYNVLPIVCTTTSYQKKTNLDDKLVQYTFEFEFAYDKINNIR